MGVGEGGGQFFERCPIILWNVSIMICMIKKSRNFFFLKKEPIFPLKKKKGGGGGTAYACIQVALNVQHKHKHKHQAPSTALIKY